MKLFGRDRHKVIKILQVAFLVVFGLYIITGLIIFPLALKWFLQNKLTFTTPHTLQVRQVRFNPLLLKLSLKNLEIFDEHNDRIIGFDRFGIDLSFLALLRQHYRIEHLSLDAPYGKIVLSDEGRLNLMGLQPVLPEKTEKSPPPAATPPPEEQPAIPTVIVDEIVVSGMTIRVHDENPATHFDHVIRPVNIHLLNLATHLTEQGHFDFQINVAGGGTIGINGRVTLLPLLADVNLKLTDVALPATKAYVEEYSHARVADGRLNLIGQARFDGANLAEPQLTFLGGVSVKELKILDTDEALVLGWKELALNPIRFDLAKRQLSVGEIAFTGLTAQATLLPDGSNIQKLLKTPPEAPETAAAAPAGKQKPSEPATTVPAGTAAPVFEAVISKVALRDGAIHISDRTITPPFELALKDITADITGISTDPNSEVKANISTTITDKGRLDIETRTRPLVQPLTLDTTFKLKDFAMTVLTPYVGTYTGATVGKGKLRLDFDYQIADNTIEAKHAILIDQFTFGEKFPSDKALNLPFSLVLSLLKNAQGQIKLNLPVTGDLSSPDFHYLQVAGQVARNFILGIVTKPFAFLASAVGAGGSEEDFGEIRFAPGDSMLRAEEKEKLLALSTALKDRPGLRLEIPGAYDPEHDWHAVKQDAFQKQYAAMQEEYTEDEDQLLHRLYQKNFGLPAYWELVKKYRRDHPEDKKESGIIPVLREDLIVNAPADREALNELARQRAEAVYQFFINSGGLPADRLTQAAGKEVSGSNDAVPLEMTLTVLE